MFLIIEYVVCTGVEWHGMKWNGIEGEEFQFSEIFSEINIFCCSSWLSLFLDSLSKSELQTKQNKRRRRRRKRKREQNKALASGGSPPPANFFFFFSCWSPPWAGYLASSFSFYILHLVVTRIYFINKFCSY